MEEEIVLKLLHTADWHLGRRFRSFGDDAGKELMRARLAVIERILLQAERNAVHAVLCAGDLFDDPAPQRDWWEPLAQSFAKRAWRDRPVFLLPGNHDPLLPESVWAPEHPFRKLLPDWVYVVDRPDFKFALPGNAILFGVPCQSKAGQSDPTEFIPKREVGDERIRIGLVHGSTFDLPDCLTNFPIARDAAIERGLDYLAIGDTHGFRFVPPDRQEQPTVYPGAPEATAFDEKDPGNVALVFVNRQRCATVRPERVAYWTWEDVQARSVGELRKLATRSDLGARVVRLRLSMRVPAPEYEEVLKILDDLKGTEARRGRIGILDLDRQGLELEVDDIEQHCSGLPEVLQSVIGRLRETAGDPAQKSVAERALFHLYRTTRAGAR
jgi:DNA repair exonuclease SbcCD nuclease subunit